MDCAPIQIGAAIHSRVSHFSSSCPMNVVNQDGRSIFGFLSLTGLIISVGNDEQIVHTVHLQNRTGGLSISWLSIGYQGAHG
jgi:hypothetical protein